MKSRDTGQMMENVIIHLCYSNDENWANKVVTYILYQVKRYKYNKFIECEASSLIK